MTDIKVTKATLRKIMYQALVKASLVVPQDVERSLKAALVRESNPLAKLQLEMTLANMESSRQGQGLACADTGFPLFYVVMGEKIQIEGGLSILYDTSRQAVARATKEFKLRSTMVDPLTRRNTGTNCGYYIPSIDVRFDPRLTGMKIVAVLKGGGAEIYGSFFKMMLPAHGREGVTKFILDSVVEGAQEGKTCPPSVVGVGIGGTSDICMKLAKEAAVLRSIGSRHPDKEIAQYEEDLMDAINSLEIGPMGTGGRTTVLDLHVETAVTHTGALPVGVNIQCAIARRCVAEVDQTGKITYGDTIHWSYR